MMVQEELHLAITLSDFAIEPSFMTAVNALQNL